jgi:hypothetical protein
MAESVHRPCSDERDKAQTVTACLLSNAFAQRSRQRQRKAARLGNAQQRRTLRTIGVAIERRAQPFRIPRVSFRVFSEGSPTKRRAHGFFLAPE